MSGRKIIEGLEEAVAFAEGDVDGTKVTRVHRTADGLRLEDVSKRAAKMVRDTLHRLMNPEPKR